ncbi:thioredoxin domain-containing protein [Stieleria sp. JC731]|uniref:vitamin K epoxide reductase family protein n=1 Tax=Pirellulaceae TaxID=2691357 RepID=UPI001E549679|nr:vitamin K epoxide reductase family protein [Stieleria sp. JC731]MCC9598953.1 thioredoxin domain-containing protein [Stieleria sp. JC731]
MSLADIYRPKLRNPAAGYDPVYGPIGGKSSTFAGKTVFERSVNWWVMLVGSSIALITSSYLAWSSLTSSSVAGCGGDLFDCSNVLHSRFSSVMSVPVSIPAMIAHATILGMLFWQPVSQAASKVRWSILGLLAFSVAAAAIWFVGLQFIWLQHLCPYCLAAHTAGLIVLGAYLTSGHTYHGVSKVALALVALVGTAGFIGLQFLNDAPVTYEVIDHTAPAATEVGTESLEETSTEMELFEAPTLSSNDSSSSGMQAEDSSESTHLVSDHQMIAFAMSMFSPVSIVTNQVTAEDTDSADEPSAAETNSADVVPSSTVRLLKNVKLETASWPLIGKPDAELVFVEMFDYTCPHCQRTHRSLEAARKHFGDRLAVISLPVPLDRDCNPTVRSTSSSHAEACELAKLAVAVWMTDRDQFDAFHNYLFESRPRYSQAYAKARTMVDAAKLDSTMRGTGPSDYISKHVTLYQRAGSGTIPKLLFPETTVAGAVESPQSFINLIERNLR